ncbi:hypothetical protein SAMN06264364_1651 [Quadrisphaera granulorum]|uniref:DDE superfamily endonuclease n=1 Tax=Quadrisphaera granulorum TaxID=317664 RepID=A0A315ZYM0_9ACTN|nr:hypothetical protein [Quadrisphaera granulorum]PWJ42457.1 hypothetical protein BXY45_1651 [Quadrisphaera granulorum]SZE99216.1 hypothetical protein SAMN06264364_1651 [Quadrisphaera granulorum]
MSDPVTYTATLPISRDTVERIAVLLHARRRQLRTRNGRRALGCFTQGLLLCRWTLQATRVPHLAADHRLSLSTAYRYLAEVLDVLAVQAPGLHGACWQRRSPGTRTSCSTGRSSPSTTPWHQA